MTIDLATTATTRPSVSVARRMLACMWGQAGRTGRCPGALRADGRLALVTGGARGVGLETTRGLLARGADVVMASRSESSGHDAQAELAGAGAGRASFCRLALDDLDQIPVVLDALEKELAGRRLDVLVANAGVWPQRYGVSAQGHETAFATNVLGHHAFLQGLRQRGLLSEDARVVVVTGDIYIMARECTADYRYRGPLGGQLAYCRSKLGNLWWAFELADRAPGLRVHAVHPGVIASDLGGASGGVLAGMKSLLMLPLEAGAQTSLFCALAPDLESGTYYHNVLGRMELAPEDPGADRDAARALWDQLEALAGAG